MARSLRFVVASLAVSVGLGVAASSAPAAVPPETPIVSSDLTPNPGNVAKPTDDVMHPDSWVEWWYVLLMDPHSKRQLVSFITSAPAPLAVSMLMFNDGTNAFSSTDDTPSPVAAMPTTPPKNDGLPGVRTPAATLDYDPTHKVVDPATRAGQPSYGAYHFVLNNGFKSDVWLDGSPLAGATGIIDLKNAGEWMGWTSPVLTSTAHGWVETSGGKRINVDGWRAYHDHNWGHFTMVDQVADGWEWGVSFEPNGGAHAIGGLVRRGAQWVGSVVDAQPNGTRICAASKMTQSDWYSGDSYLTGSTFSLPGTVQADCYAPAGGYTSGEATGPFDFSTTFHLTDPVVGDAALLALSLEARYQTVPGSFGIYEHVRSLISRLEELARTGGAR